MPEIFQMSTTMANLVAAGEVVERPGSVVKELVENALDAGAKHITVEIRNGGVSYIRVTDDGKGIQKEDVRTAFLRHATSKVRFTPDLDAIKTLGFRGEALAAIAAVSRVDLFTRTEGEISGVQISLEGGAETGYGETGCPVGTTIVVRDLFFNVPARAKFLKKDATESANIESVVAQCAIVHPKVVFRLLKDGRESFSTPGTDQMKKAVYAIYGRELAEQMLQLTYCEGETEVTGLTSPASINRANRTQENFYLNGRYIHSRLLSSALEEAYKGKLMTGRYPVCFLEVKTNPAAVDVNVHPAKLEVKFSREKEIFTAVYRAAISTLGDQGKLNEPCLREQAPVREDHVTQEQQTIPVQRAELVYPTLQIQALKDSLGRVTYMAEEPLSKSRLEMANSERIQYQTLSKGELESPEGKPQESKTDAPLRAERSRSGNVPENPQHTVSREQDAAKRAEMPEITEKQHPAAAPVTEECAPEPLPEPEIRIVGEAFHTYIIAEDRDGLWLIDKHAAHEKMLYDRIRAGIGQMEAQLLLRPAVVTLAATEKESCLSHRDLLKKAGFEIEDYGGNALAVREIPMYLEEQDVGYVLSDLAQKCQQGIRGENELLESLMKSMACKAAVKAGTVTEPPEMEQLAKRVLSDGEIRNCPHGRPCITHITRYQLEKMFKRVQ